jgi:hypothetical protein
VSKWDWLLAAAGVVVICAMLAFVLLNANMEYGNPGLKP